MRTAAGSDVVDVVSSMGGYVAVSWAASRPDEVGELTLLAPALVPLQPAWRLPGLTRLIGIKKILDVDENPWDHRLASISLKDFFVDGAPHHLDTPVEWRQAILDYHRAAITDPLQAVGGGLAKTSCAH